MKIVIPALFLIFFSFAATQPKRVPAVPVSNSDSIPFVFGNFTDDYGIHYSINETLWVQLPVIKYHILTWNSKEQYFVARNDDQNPSEAGLYTRIDYMAFTGMKPWLWGFCYTVYKAKTDAAAIAATAADRSNPRKGCNGFPFSRMMKTE